VNPLEGVERLELLPGVEGIRVWPSDGGRCITYADTSERGLRWKCGGWISRDYIDQRIGCPGAADTMEAFWRLMHSAVKEQRRALEVQREELARENHLAAQEMYRAEERVRAAAANGRHMALRRWRGENPVPPSQRPAALRHVRNIKRLDTDQPCRVYFLVHGGEVVYVGQTASPWPSRIDSHISEGSKVFDEVWYLEVDAASLNTVESHYIRTLCPKYNTAHKPVGVAI
jgi:hypothetical protein